MSILEFHPNPSSMRPILLFCVLSFCGSSILSQSVYSGEVVDANGDKVIFAQIFFNQDQKYGAVTNEVGEFSIKVKEANKTDNLVISCLGYETLFVAYADLPTTGPLVMAQVDFVIEEVTIRSGTYLRHLLKECIKAIPQNYPEDKHILKAYYQDYTLSDSEYTELIEADLSILTEGYSKKKIKQKFYLEQLRKTEDRRYLPEHLRSDRNKVLYTAQSYNIIGNRTFSRFGFVFNERPSLEEFLDKVDELSSLELYTQYIQQGDTILTIKVEDSIFKILNISGEELKVLYALVSINLTDKAVVKVVYGDVWREEADFGVMAYRKIEDKYYPSYLRNVLEFEHNQGSHHHYNAKSIFFYDLVTGRKNLRKYRKGKKLKLHKGLRLYKDKVDDNFWKNYNQSYNVDATTLLRTKFEFVK